MKPRTPLWPYLLVLGFLFVLSLAAPHGWGPAASDSATSVAIGNQDSAKLLPSDTAEVVCPDRSLGSDGHDSLAGAAELTPASAAPQRDDSADKTADTWQFNSAAELTSHQGPSNPVVAAPIVVKASIAADSPVPQSALVQSSETTINQPALPQSASPALNLQSLADRASAWQNKVVGPAAGELSDLTGRVGQTLTQRPFKALSDAIKSIRLSMPQPTVAAPQPNVATQGDAALSTEVPLPSVLSSLTPPSVLHVDVSNSAPPQPTAAEPADVAPPIASETPLPPPAWPISLNLVASADALAKINGCGSWAENVHRALEQLNRLGESDRGKATEVLRDLRRLAAEAGLLSKRMKDAEAALELRRLQYDLVRRLDVWEELCTPRSVASVLQLRNQELIALVERYEQTQRSADGRQLAELSRQLQASSTPADKELGRRLHMHYRNANVRIALTAALLDRLLPEQQPTNDPVAETILGAPVQGQSTTAARLTLQLLPDPQIWRFNLVASGTVDSLTSTTHGPVTFVNQGAARFVVRKLVLLNAEGVRVKPATAEADANSNLSGMHTSYDSIPLLRSVVRNYAMSQRQQQIDQANWESAQKVAERACGRVDEQLEPRLLDAEKKFRDRCLQPLKYLGLDPTVVALETTDVRLVFRGRLAGAEQLGAFTARPEALADSLASAQLHESVLNNLLDNLDLAGKKFALPELLKHLNSKLGRSDAKLADDLPEGVQITFAAEQPLHVHCDDDRLVLVLHIAEIRQGKHRWHDFEVRAAYKPATDGLSAALERDGTIELGGQYQGRPEVALRGIFSKVLSRERKLELIPKAVAGDPRLADLQVTQLLMDNGWIALSIGLKAAVARRASR